MICDRCYQPADQGEHGLFLCPLEPRRDAAVVWADEIPGGLEIEHGLCNPDGTPRTYYSRSEIKSECERRGLIPWSEIHTEDKTKDARVRMDWLQSSEAKRQKADRDEQRRAGVYQDWKRVAPKQSSPATREAVRQAVIRRIQALR